MQKSEGRGARDRLGLAIAFLAVLIGTIGVTPVMADSPQPPESTTTEIEGVSTPVVGPGEVGPGGTRIPTEAEMEATLQHFEEKEEEAQAGLETPQAAAERNASKTAYEGVSTAEAEQLLRSDFGRTLETLNSDPARFLSDAELDRTFDEYAAQVTSEGETTVMEGAMPVEAGEGSSQGKVDLGLEESAEGWEPENPLVPVTIGKTAEEGVEVGERITVTQVGGEEVEGNEFGDKNVFFGEVETDTDQLVAPTARGVELFDLLRSAASPGTLRFRVGMPAGAELVEAEGGAAIGLRAG